MTAALLALAIQAPPKFTLQLFQDEFVVRQGAQKILAPLRLEPPKPKLSVVFRKGDHFAVWDDRGLSIRTGKRTLTTKLKEVSVSPRVFEREEIRANLDLMKLGKRSREASALSGAKRIGNDAYFLVRWDDSAGAPWLEALISVPLDEGRPQWKLLGKFEGLTLAKLPIDDKLVLHNGMLSAITVRGSDWGESFYTANMKAFGFRKFGSRLIDFSAADKFEGDFVEKSSYGTNIAGQIDLESGQRSEFMESKAAIKMLDAQAPKVAIVSTKAGASLRNADSGAEIRLPASSAVRRAGSGIVVWTPSTKPTKAWLYDPERWEILATWSQAARAVSPTTAGR